jgi:hypothetical protein
MITMLVLMTAVILNLVVPSPILTALMTICVPLPAVILLLDVHPPLLYASLEMTVVPNPAILKLVAKPKLLAAMMAMPALLTDAILIQDALILLSTAMTPTHVLPILVMKLAVAHTHPMFALYKTHAALSTVHLHKDAFIPMLIVMIKTIAPAILVTQVVPLILLV